MNKLQQRESIVVDWQLKDLNDFSVTELYNLLKIRQEIFIVEQQCCFVDIDDHDHKAKHLIGYITSNGDKVLAAYLRILLSKQYTNEISFGRVLVNIHLRGLGLGKALLIKAISYSLALGKRITISAQAHLQKFYESLGFLQISEPYLEDNILHIRMALGTLHPKI
jgi:ElaA protein